jgi:CubicO group peptidase (beta-lactamase class C family)
MSHLRRLLSPWLVVALMLVVFAAACSSDPVTDTADSVDQELTEPDTEEAAESEESAEPEDTVDSAEEDADESAEDTDESAEDEPAVEGFAAVTESVLYEEYFGTFSADRISMIASSSKMISAGVLLRLQEDGLLDIDAPIEGVVDWAVGNPEITPAQLVSNSSGLVGLGPDLLYAPYLCQWGVPNTLQECGEAVFTSAGDDADQIPPDTEFRYGGAQWQVAGAVAEAVSGKTWEQLIDEIYVGPCGVESLGYISLGAVPIGPGGYPVAFGGDPDSVTASDNPNIEGGAHITAADYGKLLLMHLRGGMCGDSQVFTQASLDTMHADRVASAYNGDASAPDTGYGMGWWVNRETG